MIVDFTFAIGHMTRSSYELMWIFNFVPLTPRLYVGDVHHDIQKLRVIDKVKVSVENVYERRHKVNWNWHKRFVSENELIFLFCFCFLLVVHLEFFIEHARFNKASVGMRIVELLSRHRIVLRRWLNWQHVCLVNVRLKTKCKLTYSQHTHTHLIDWSYCANLRSKLWYVAVNAATASASASQRAVLGRWKRSVIVQQRWPLPKQK